MAQGKTRPTEVSPDDFIASLDDPAKRADSLRLVDLMARLSHEPATMWGPTIIGFGRYHYRYASGHEGDTCVIGFSPRKAEFSIYLNGLAEGAGMEKRDVLLRQLGQHRIGKACLYVKRLDAIDMKVLATMIELSIAETHSRYAD